MQIKPKFFIRCLDEEHVLPSSLHRLRKLQKKKKKNRNISLRYNIFSPRSTSVLSLSLSVSPLPACGSSIFDSLVAACKNFWFKFGPLTVAVHGKAMTWMQGKGDQMSLG